MTLRLAVTGVSGFLGQGLLRRLAATGVTDRIVGLDVAVPAFCPRELDFHLVDIGGSDIKPLLEGVEVLVHLAGIHDAIPDVDLMARVNVGGTRRVLAAAGGVRKIVVVGSATVYGAWPNNPVPLDEEAPLRPNPGFPPAVQKAETERLVAEWASTHPGAVTTILRAATVIGPHADHALARLVRARLSLGLAGAEGPVQFLHEEDAVSALVAAMELDLPGTFNVAADGWVDRDAFRGLAGRRLAPRVSPTLAEGTLRRLWAAGLVDLPASAVPYLMHPWVVSIDRLRAAGWAPRYSNEEAIVACLGHGSLSLRRPAAAAAMATGVGLALWSARRSAARQTPRHSG